MVESLLRQSSGKYRHHMMPMNNPEQLTLLAEEQSVLYRCKILTFANLLRVFFVLVNVVFSPMIIQAESKQIFIWQDKFIGREYILFLGTIYIVFLSILTLFNLKKNGKEILFLFNAIIDILFLLLFMIALDITQDWNLLFLSLLSSIFLSILTLNILQCGIYVIFLYLEVMLFYVAWNVVIKLSFSVVTLIDIIHHFDVIFLQSIKLVYELSDAAEIVGILVLVVFLLGYLANNARENKIMARINQSSLQQTQQLNESIIAEISSGLIVVNHKGELIAMNRRVRELFHIYDNAIPHRLFNLHPTLARQLARWENLKHNQLYTIELYGETYSITFTPLEFKQYSPLIMLALEDVQISYQRVRETRLASLGRLTAGIAHEIRNPLSSVQSANELILELAEDNPKIQYLCKKIANNTKRMNAIISDILDMFRGGEGNHQLLELNNFVRLTVENSRSDNDLEKTPISIELNATENCAVYFDPGHLSQILHNLMLNSIKHSGRSDVSIRIIGGIGEGGRSVYLDVMDNGQGIAKEDYEHIFEPFFSKHEGIGLGLYLVREMCLANQAHITYIPNMNGSCFRIIMERYLPQKQS